MDRNRLGKATGADEKQAGLQWKCLFVKQWCCTLSHCRGRGRRRRRRRRRKRISLMVVVIMRPNLIYLALIMLICSIDYREWGGLGQQLEDTHSTNYSNHSMVVMIREGDYQALLAIKYAFIDPHGALSTWLEHRELVCSPKSWFGVACSDVGRVVSLQLPRKGLYGRISPQAGRLSALRRLNLHSNHLSGGIPDSLGNLANLRGLYLFSNRLVGKIPTGFPSSHSLRALDFSRNRLSGSIPANLAAHSANLERVDLSFNSFSGTIPQILTTFGGLKYLSLAHNRLNGGIPSSLSQLTQLEMLDLSVNELTGSIPKELTELDNLTAFNCSDNRLEGAVPPLLAKRFDPSSFLPNSGLCEVGSSSSGDSAVPLCASSPSSNSNSQKPFSVQLRNHTRNGTVAGKPPDAAAALQSHCCKTVPTLVFVILGSVVAGALSVCLILALIWRCSASQEKPEKPPSTPLGSHSSSSQGRNAATPGKLVHFEEPNLVQFNAEELLCATAEVLGKSSYGTLYKATMENGRHLAVKRLREGVVRSQKEFENELNNIGLVKHPNLLALKAYYCGPKDERLLVFDYIRGGNLATFLHARRPEMAIGWEARIRIAIGVAHGLAHLHQQKMVHGYLSAVNILLDVDMSPIVSDFGLPRLMTGAANVHAMATVSASGYCAPELTRLRKASVKSDVYSFGVVLLELLTGKAPAETTAKIGMDLPEWVASTIKEEWTNEIFDLDIMKTPTPPLENVLISTLQLAMDCVNLLPSNRPLTPNVYQQLNAITSSS